LSKTFEEIKSERSKENDISADNEEEDEAEEGLFDFMDNKRRRAQRRKPSRLRN
jgi:uncharacterized Zn finger protein (UPF0148 family)